MTGHPTAETLVRYFEGVDGANETEATERHLSSCLLCRAEVTALRRLGPALRDLPEHPAPAALWSRIEESLAGRHRQAELKKRVLSSHESPRRVLEDVAASSDIVPGPIGSDTEARSPARSRRASPIVIAASLFLVTAIAVVLTSTEELAAGASMLRMTNVGRPGSLLIRYETPSAFASEPRLRVRLKYWTADPNRIVLAEGGYEEAELARVKSGVFETRVTLLENVVYSRASIETVDGRLLDTNQGRFWEFFAERSDGRGSFEARWWQVLALQQTHSARAYRAAREATADFPESPELWATVLLYEVSTAAPASLDSIRLRHRQRFVTLDQHFRSIPAMPSQVAMLGFYAELLEDEPGMQYWEERLLTEYPLHEFAIQRRIETATTGPGDLRTRLEALETEWSLSQRELIARAGVSLAFRLGSTATTLRWVDRLDSTRTEHDVDFDVGMAERLSEAVRLRARAESWIRDRLEPAAWRSARRPLDRTREDYETIRAEEQGRLRAALAGVLLAKGDTAAARDALGDAAAGTWNRQLFRQTADMLLSIGDTTAATEVIARVLVDPVTGGAGPDPTWPHPAEEALARAAADLHEVASRGLVRESLQPGVSLHDATNSIRMLDELIAGKSTLVLYWWELDGIGTSDLQLLADNLDKLERAGIALLLLIQESLDSTSEMAAGLADLNVPVYADIGLEAADRMRIVGAPYFVLIDRASTIRYRSASLESAIRASLTLNETPRTPADQTAVVRFHTNPMEDS